MELSAGCICGCCVDRRVQVELSAGGPSNDITRRSDENCEHDNLKQICARLAISSLAVVGIQTTYRCVSFDQLIKAHIFINTCVTIITWLMNVVIVSYNDTHFIGRPY